MYTTVVLSTRQHFPTGPTLHFSPFLSHRPSPYHRTPGRTAAPKSPAHVSGCCHRRRGRGTTDLAADDASFNHRSLRSLGHLPRIRGRGSGLRRDSSSLVAWWPRSSTFTGRRGDTQDLDDSGNPAYASWLVTAGGGRRLDGAPPLPAHRGAPMRRVVARRRADPSQGPP
jgi:hypothetical protein